jgi:hypothetical protein
LPSNRHSRKGLQPQRVGAPVEVMDGGHVSSTVAWSSELCVGEHLSMRKAQWSAPAGGGPHGPVVTPFPSDRASLPPSARQRYSERDNEVHSLVEAREAGTAENSMNSWDGVGHQRPAEGASMAQAVHKASCVCWGPALNPVDSEIDRSVDAVVLDLTRTTDACPVQQQPHRKRQHHAVASPQYARGASNVHEGPGNASYTAFASCTGSAHKGGRTGGRNVHEGPGNASDTASASLSASMHERWRSGRSTGHKNLRITRGAPFSCMASAHQGGRTDVSLASDSPHASASMHSSGDHPLTSFRGWLADKGSKSEGFAVGTRREHVPQPHMGNAPVSMGGVEGGVAGAARSASEGSDSPKRRKIGFRVRGLAVAKARMQGALPWW